MESMFIHNVDNVMNNSSSAEEVLAAAHEELTGAMDNLRERMGAWVPVLLPNWLPAWPGAERSQRANCAVDLP